MGIYRSTDPTVWDDVDGIIINEVAPPPSVGGVPANIAIMVGQFQRGPVNELIEVGSLGEVYENLGNDISYKGQIALQNKRFGALKLLRVAASDAAKATQELAASATDRISFTGK